MNNQITVSIELVVNGRLISKEDDINDWLHKTSHDGCSEVHLDGDEYDQWLIENFEGFWLEYCQNNALIYNEDCACISF